MPGKATETATGAILFAVLLSACVPLSSATTRMFSVPKSAVFGITTLSDWLYEAPAAKLAESDEPKLAAKSPSFTAVASSVVLLER